MKKLWRQFAELVTALKNSFSIDIFAEARFKIAFLFLVMGIVILGVAGYLIYMHSLAIVQSVIQLLQQVLVTRGTIDQSATTNLIAQTVGNEVQQMNLVVGFWIVVTLVISAYILAGVALTPTPAPVRQRRRAGGMARAAKPVASCASIQAVGKKLARNAP